MLGVFDMDGPGMGYSILIHLTLMHIEYFFLQHNHAGIKGKVTNSENDETTAENQEENEDDTVLLRSQVNGGTCYLIIH